MHTRLRVKEIIESPSHLKNILNFWESWYSLGKMNFAFHMVELKYSSVFPFILQNIASNTGNEYGWV